MVKKMAPKPLILALANPDPEILPEDAKAARPDCIIATGRSDYPNQVNNVLCFPFIFRGALDVGATKITDEMKLACVRALAELAQAEQSDIVAMAYGGQDLSFGPDYIIPRPFDPRLILRIAPAVAKAAMDSGVATRPIKDFDAYRERLNSFVYHSATIMSPVFHAAKRAPKRVIFAEGEEERVLRAAQIAVDEGLAKPILIGRPEVIDMRIKRFGLRLAAGKQFEIVNPENDPRYRDVWTEYHKLMGRHGITPDIAKEHVRQFPTLIGAMLIRRGDADAMLCGVIGRYRDHLRHVANVLGREAGAKMFAAMNVLMLTNRTVFICDTYVNENPTAEQLAEMTMMAAEEMKRFGITPKVALLSHSNFGSADDSPAARKMADAAQDPGEDGARPRGRGRDARRRRAVGGDPPARAARVAAEGRGEPARHAEPRRGEHRVQPAQGDRRRRDHRRADPARRGEGGAHRHAERDRAAARQHDRARGRGRRRSAAADGVVGARQLENRRASGGSPGCGEHEGASPARRGS